MAKKNLILDLDDEDIILDKKAKRKLAKAQQQKQANAFKINNESQSKAESESNDISAADVAISEEEDVMGHIAELCQSENWREAALVCLEEIARQEAAGTPENAIGIQMAYQKISKSLRRKMVAALIRESCSLLKKEYLLDV